MATTFEYSVLRLIPDSARGEQINVGIVVFLEGGLDVRVFPDLAKVRALNPDVDITVLRKLPQALNNLVGNKGTTEERHASLSRMPLINATKIGWFACEPQDYEIRLNELINRFVLTPTRKVHISTTRLGTEMRAAFKKSKITITSEPSEITKHHVVQNYPVAAAEGLIADFALKNGVMHFTAALDLRGKESTIRSDKRGQAAIKSLTLDRAKEQYKNCTRLAVYIADPRYIEIIEPHLAILRHYADELYDFGNRHDQARYIERMHAAAMH
jgi:hypothetical protein